VVNTWEEQSFSGWMGFVLKDRLKGLKLRIKDWNAEIFGNAEVKKKQLVEKILDLDLRSEGVGISPTEVLVRKQLFVDLWALLKSIDASIYQRSRARWMKDGETNSRYFHACIKARNRGNKIEALRTPLGWVNGPSGVREAVVSFFKNHFDAEVWNRLVLDGLVFPTVLEENNAMLAAVFTFEEITAVVHSMDGSKCPGPDGFNFNFIKEFWWLLRHDIRIFFD
jgi:hypothetical protein